MDIKVAVVSALIIHSRLVHKDIMMLSAVGDNLNKICLLTLKEAALKYINSNYFPKRNVATYWAKLMLLQHLVIMQHALH